MNFAQCKFCSRQNGKTAEDLAAADPVTLLEIRKEVSLG